MILDFNNILDASSEVKVLCGKSYKVIYLDDRARNFDETKPFAYSNGFYYVCCPCCHQIERVAEHYFQDASIAKIQCSTRTITQKVAFTKGSKGIDSISFKRLAYTLNLEGWNV